jgi:hypothetical protein
MCSISEMLAERTFMPADANRVSEATQLLVSTQVDELDRDHGGAEPINRALLADGIVFALERGASIPTIHSSGAA